MTVFKLETKNKTDGSWNDAMKFTPEYRMAIKQIGWIFRKKIGIIGNLEEAEEHAHEKALTYARAMYHATACRLIKQTIIDGVKSVDIVWQNGHEVHHEQISVWHRLWEWIWE